MNHDDLSTSERLVRATSALAQTPIADELPSELTLRAQQIPFVNDRKMAHRIGWIVAAVIVLSLGGAVFFLLQHTSEIAFADVVQSVGRTHTLTAIEDLVEPFAPERGIKYFARGDDVRAEGATWVQVTNHKTGQFLLLSTSNRMASVENNIPPAKCDLYQIIRNYDGKNVQPVGDKIIDGRALQGFRTVVANESPPFNTMIIWVDKSTKLPVRVENGPILMRDLQFDVPLADSLFDTAIPAGYTVSNHHPAQQFQFAGQVVDEQGKPIANVDVRASQRDISINSRAVLYLGPHGTTDKSGHFSMDCSVDVASDEPIRLEFRHTDFMYARLEDLRLMSQDMQRHLQVRLHHGRSVTGQVFDESGRPVAGAVIQSICDHVGADDPGNVDVQYDYAKQTASDDQGRFAIHGLPGGKILLQVQKSVAGSPLLTAQGEVNWTGSTTLPATLQITAKPLEVDPGTEIHQLFGMKLVDIDPALRDRLSLGPWDNLLILDMGPEVARLHLETIAAGDIFWRANSGRIKNFHEFAQQLLTTCEEQQKQGRSEFDVKVNWDFVRPNGSGARGEDMHLNESDLAELRKAVQP